MARSALAVLFITTKFVMLCTSGLLALTASMAADNASVEIEVFIVKKFIMTQ